MAKPRDTATADLFANCAPPPAVERYDVDQVRAYKCSHRVARAVSEALKRCGHSRDVVAQQMSEWLGESVSPGMLNHYASPSNDGHNIPAHRLVALAVVTGDGARLFNALIADAGLIAVPDKFEPLLRRELAKEAAEKLTREASAADAQWRAGR